MFAVSPNLVSEGNNAKSQTSLWLSPLDFSFAVGYSYFLHRKTELLKSVLNSVALAPLLQLAPVLLWAQAHTYKTQHLDDYLSRDFFFPRSA